MLNKMRSYINDIFEDAPQNRKTEELKDEIYFNLAEKYQDKRSKGATEQEAYNSVIAGMGDVNELVEELKASNQPPLSPAELKKHALWKSIAIGLYILCAVPILVLQSAMGVVFTLVIVAVATSMLIYSATLMPEYEKEEDSMVEDFKALRMNNQRSRSAWKSFHSAYWSLVTILFFAIGFFAGGWAYSWLVFVLGAAVENIIKGLMILGGKDEK